MNFKFIKTNLVSFIISYIIIVLISSFLSYNFFIGDFEKLEEKQNQNNIQTILTGVNHTLETIERLITDYSKWDDTYDFILNPNPEYIYENFREGTTTLEDLGLDFILFSNLQEQTIYSKYPNTILKTNKNDLEQAVYSKFKKVQNENTLFKYKSYSLYLIKSEILKSDSTGDIRGFIYTGKIINNKNLNDITKIFKKMYISNKEIKSQKIKTDFSYLKNIKLAVNKNDSSIINHIQLYDKDNAYIFSIITENERKIVNKGKKTNLTFSIILSIFLLIIFYIIYRNQTILERYNELLKSKVTTKTAQLNKTLRKLEHKNKELYSLANIDSLTKIRNRRNFFLESKKALENAILNDSKLSVLMMDIDFFKKINDTYGHGIGDKVLIEFCAIINSIVDKDAIFGRIGGEEFCITFINIELSEASNIAEKIREACENSIIEVEDKKIKFTLSSGLSDRENFDNIDDILQMSDKLLYKAKKGGRNRLIRTNS